MHLRVFACIIEFVLHSLQPVTAVCSVQSAQVRRRLLIWQPTPTLPSPPPKQPRSRPLRTRASTRCASAIFCALFTHEHEPEQHRRQLYALRVALPELRQPRPPQAQPRCPTRPQGAPPWPILYFGQGASCGTSCGMHAVSRPVMQACM